MIVDRKLHFTNHARRRMYELGISMDTAMSMIRSSNRIHNNGLEEYKIKKYGYEQLKIQYWRSGAYTFTIKVSENIKVITVSNEFMSRLRRKRERK